MLGLRPRIRPRGSLADLVRAVNEEDTNGRPAKSSLNSVSNIGELPDSDLDLAIELSTASSLPLPEDPTSSSSPATQHSPPPSTPAADSLPPPRDSDNPSSASLHPTSPFSQPEDPPNQPVTTTAAKMPPVSFQKLISNQRLVCLRWRHADNLDDTDLALPFLESCRDQGG